MNRALNILSTTRSVTGFARTVGSASATGWMATGAHASDLSLEITNSAALAWRCGVR